MPIQTALEVWVAHRWIVPYEASESELNEQLVAASGDIADAQKDLSPGWRFAIAYNAALRLCNVALMARGYRAQRDQKHYRTIASLEHTIGTASGDLPSYLQACRVRRHDVTYEANASVSDAEADELVRVVGELQGLVTRWNADRARRR